MEYSDDELKAMTYWSEGRRVDKPPSIEPTKQNSKEIGRFMINDKPFTRCDLDDFNALYDEIYELVTSFEDRYHAKAKLITMNKKLDEILGYGFLMYSNGSIYKADTKTILDIPCQFKLNLEYDYIIE